MTVGHACLGGVHATSTGLDFSGEETGEDDIMLGLLIVQLPPAPVRLEKLGVPQQHPIPPPPGPSGQLASICVARRMESRHEENGEDDRGADVRSGEGVDKRDDRSAIFARVSSSSSLISPLTRLDSLCSFSRAARDSSSCTFSSLERASSREISCLSKTAASAFSGKLSSSSGMLIAVLVAFRSLGLAGIGVESGTRSHSACCGAFAGVAGEEVAGEDLSAAFGLGKGADGFSAAFTLFGGLVLGAEVGDLFAALFWPANNALRLLL